MDQSVIKERIEESIDIKRSLLSQTSEIIKIVNLIVETFKNGNKVLFFGNGGSAADAQHLAAELAGRFYIDRTPLPAMALTTNSSTMTAIANDYGYEQTFSRQVRAFAHKGDVIIGISTSGNSENVVKAFQLREELGIYSVAFTGKDGELGEISDFTIYIESDNTARIQEAHITVGHIICELVEYHLFREEKYDYK